MESSNTSTLREYNFMSRKTFNNILTEFIQSKAPKYQESTVISRERAEKCIKILENPTNNELKNSSLSKPIIANHFMTRVQIDLLDLSSRPDGSWKYIAHARDHFSHFSWAVPLESKCAFDVAVILKLSKWLEDTKRIDWSTGLSLYAMNTEYSHEYSHATKHTLYEIIFGQKPRCNLPIVEALYFQNCTCEEDIPENIALEIEPILENCDTINDTDTDNDNESETVDLTNDNNNNMNEIDCQVHENENTIEETGDDKENYETISTFQ
ncbi:15781_t:CDS:2 [Dentiscutata heterogama]|uniref:15781_t:CDS:1 n=1 Tax=Dentiscutata heterogama TaxID=1316150 RepID=A0ACA9LXN5_9GLOM|nr:15781_t:CDS:2 [Dentiscutata heterogama]